MTLYFRIVDDGLCDPVQGEEKVAETENGWMNGGSDDRPADEYKGEERSMKGRTRIRQKQCGNERCRECSILKSRVEEQVCCWAT